MHLLSSFTQFSGELHTVPSVTKLNPGNYQTRLYIVDAFVHGKYTRAHIIGFIF
jgi:hypothetical protein